MGIRKRNASAGYLSEVLRKMTTFKQFIAEGFLADQRTKMYDVKKGIANALKVLSFKIGAHRASLDGDRGIKWIISYKLPESQQDSFYMRLFEKLVRRELSKHFAEWKLSSAEIENWKGTPTAVVRFYLPDGDGLLP